MEKQKKIKIAIIDNDEYAIIAIKAILQDKMPNMTDISYTCNSPKEFISYCRNNNPKFDILLVDMAFGVSEKEGLDVLKYVKDNKKAYKPIVITSYVFSKDILKQAKEDGAKCYLPKNLMTDLLADVIKTVYDDKEVDDKLIKYWVGYHQLTPTEKEVFEYFATGKTSLEIADIISKEKRDKDQLNEMKPNTVERHLSEIRKKMNLQTDALAPVIAIKLKIQKVLDELGIQIIS